MWKPFALGLVAVFATSVSVFAQSPEELAARCVNKVDQVVDRLANAAAEETAECVRTINALQDAGRFEAAEEVAAECVRRATERAENAAEYVTRICNACIAELVELEEPELARRVNSACDDAIEDIRTILQREKAAIREALAE